MLNLGLGLGPQEGGNLVVGPDGNFSPSLFFGSGDATTPWYTSTQYSALYDAAVDKTFISSEELFPPPSKRFARVRAFDHATQTFGLSYATGAEGYIADDDHGAPAIALNVDGRIIACWGNHDGNWRVASSLNPHDEKTWSAPQDLVGRYAYPHLVLLPSGTMIVLMRKDFPPGTGGFAAGAKSLVYRPLTFSGSTITIGAEVNIGDMGNDSRWYQGTAILRPDGYIHQVCTKADYNDTVRLNAYFYRIDIAGARLLNLAGTAVAFPITAAAMEATFKIYTTGGSNTSNTPAMAYDTNGRAHVITHEGGTTDGGGGSAAPQVVKYLIGAAGAWVGPTDIGASTQRYNSECIIPMPDGSVKALWHKDKLNLNIRGGSCQCRILASGQPASAFGAEFTLMDPASGRGALSACIPVKDADQDIRALWAEIGTSSADSAAGERRLFAYGDSGMKANPKPAYVAPLPLVGDGICVDLSDNSRCFTDVGKTTLAVDGDTILKITDKLGSVNELTGAAGTGPIMETIGGQRCLRFGGASVGARFISGAAKAWSAGNGFMATTIMRHWMPTTASLTAASLDAGVGNARVATLCNTNGKQIRAIAFNATASTIVGGAASDHPYAQDYIVQAYTVGANIHLYVNGVLVQTLPISGGVVNASSVILRLGAAAAPTPTGFFMGAIFGFLLRTGEQTLAMRDADLAWARSQLPQ